MAVQEKERIYWILKTDTSALVAEKQVLLHTAIPRMNIFHEWSKF